MAANADQEILDRREQLLDEELDKFFNGIIIARDRIGIPQYSPLCLKR